ncbi:MAG: DUF2127 domain-containing protein [Candidatus Acidiferrales bacterium]
MLVDRSASRTLRRSPGLHSHTPGPCLSQFRVSGGKHFASVYLLSHGVVKLVLVVALFWNKLWAYPLMIIMLAAFIFYQLYRFALTHSLVMILLTLFDLVVIVLTWLEYGKQRALRQFDSPRTSQS